MSKNIFWGSLRLLLMNFMLAKFILGVKKKTVGFFPFMRVGIIKGKGGKELKNPSFCFEKYPHRDGNWGGGGKKIWIREHVRAGKERRGGRVGGRKDWYHDRWSGRPNHQRWQAKRKLSWNMYSLRTSFSRVWRQFVVRSVGVLIINKHFGIGAQPEVC